MENLVHLEGMLDRDQRTAKLRFFNSSDRQVPKTYSFPDKTVNESSPSPSSINSHNCYCPARTKSSHPSYLTWKNGYLVHNFQSLKNVLIVGVCLSLITFPSANSAPINKMNSRMNQQQKWINPCNLSLADLSTDSPKDNSGPDSEVLARIVDQANIALRKTELFRERFVKETLRMDYNEVLDIFKDQKMDWLNLLDKSLGAKTPEDKLSKLKVDDTLLDVYGFLQRVAVGLEQIVWDQIDNEGKFQQEFMDAEKQLRSVLCEIQMVIIDRGIKMRPDVERDVMKDEDRHMSITATKTRDWEIFREYMNVLEYIIEAFTYLNK